jgi:hypothetical protein
VVISSATVRHDFGKLTKKGCLWPRLDFEHRRESQKINGHLTNELLRFLAKYGADNFTLHFGVMSTGNQVTKIRGVFSYLKKHVMRGLAGDEYNRGLLALEMEAHAVAYAAEKSNVPQWLIVKGVSDYADPKKADDHREAAIHNAYKVTLSIIRDIIVDCFVREPGNQGVEEERRAKEAFNEGDILRMQEAARKAYSFGRRSPSIRRRYIATLTQSGDYAMANRLIEEFREGRELYDHVTRGIEAAILWRQGLYDEACSILPDDVIGGDRELLYLRAMSELFAKEPLDYSSAGSGMSSRKHIDKARSLLETALQVQLERKPAPWWIRVNLFWVLRLLADDPKEQEEAFANAFNTLEGAIKQSPISGTPRLYLLLLLAIGERHDDFTTEINRYANGHHIHLPLETVDMVYLRLKVLAGRGLLPQFAHYWSEICGWVRRVRTVGRPVRGETLRIMQ